MSAHDSDIPGLKAIRFATTAEKLEALHQLEAAGLVKRVARADGETGWGLTDKGREVAGELDTL